MTRPADEARALEQALAITATCLHADLAGRYAACARCIATALAALDHHTPHAPSALTEEELWREVDSALNDIEHAFLRRDVRSLARREEAEKRMYEFVTRLAVARPGVVETLRFWVAIGQQRVRNLRYAHPDENPRLTELYAASAETLETFVNDLQAAATELTQQPPAGPAPEGVARVVEAATALVYYPASNADSVITVPLHEWQQLCDAVDTRRSEPAAHPTGTADAPASVHGAPEVARVRALDAALDFAVGAIADAIYREDGLDGAAGEGVLQILAEAKKYGTCNQRSVERTEMLEFFGLADDGVSE